MGEPKKALKHLQAAMRLRQQELGPAHPDVARSKINLAAVMNQRRASVVSVSRGLCHVGFVTCVARASRTCVSPSAITHGDATCVSHVRLLLTHLTQHRHLTKVCRTNPHASPPHTPRIDTNVAQTHTDVPHKRSVAHKCRTAAPDARTEEPHINPSHRSLTRKSNANLASASHD
eukprot:3023720-Rhodomonas_salina.1